MTGLRQTEAETTEQIYKVIKESGEPLTLYDLETKTGYNYHTCRKHVLLLLERGAVEKSAYTKDRSTLFQVSDGTKTPKFRYGSDGKKASMLTVARTFATRDRGYGLARRLYILDAVHAELYHLAGRIKLSGYQNVPHKDLMAAKDNLRYLHAELTAFRNTIDDMLANQHLWDRHSLVECLLSDELTDGQEAINLAAQIEKQVQKIVPE